MMLWRIVEIAKESECFSMDQLKGYYILFTVAATLLVVLEPVAKIKADSFSKGQLRSWAIGILTGICITLAAICLLFIIV